MCDFLSAMLAKGRLYFGPTDSHAGIIIHHNLYEYGVQGANLVGLELLPDRADDPVNKWTFKINQDLLPDWFDATIAEARMRNAAVDSGVARLYADYHAKLDQLDDDYEAKVGPIRADAQNKRNQVWADRKKNYTDYKRELDRIDKDRATKLAPILEDYRIKIDRLDLDYHYGRKVIAAQIW